MVPVPDDGTLGPGPPGRKAGHPMTDTTPRQRLPNRRSSHTETLEVAGQTNHGAAGLLNTTHGSLLTSSPIGAALDLLASFERRPSGMQQGGMGS